MKHKILGDDVQAVIFDLESGEKVRAEAGAMLYMTDSIEMNTQAAGGDKGGLMGALVSGIKRVAAGESFFVTVFESKGRPGQVAFAGPYPGKIMQVDLRETGPVLCQRDSFLCSDEHVDVNIAFTRRFGAGFFGGEGFILQRLSGQGQAFIHSGGGIIPFELAPGETLRVDTGCLVGMTESVTYDVQMVKGVKNWLFGGEGLFFAKLTGPGKVWLQIMPFGRMADRILAASVRGSEQSKGVAGLGGDLLGGLLSGE